MLNQEIKNIKSGKKELRSFSRVVGGVLILLGGLAWWRGKNHFPALLVPGILLGILGQFVPGVLKPLQKVWMTAALLMGWGMTRVVLGALYFLVLTPIAIMARFSGKSFLDLKFKEGDAATYWIPKTGRKSGLADYQKQF